MRHTICWYPADLWCSNSNNNNRFIQERIAKAHGSQCGFCTPGIVMSMYALLRNNPQPTMHDIQEAFQGDCQLQYSQIIPYIFYLNNDL